MCTVTRGLKREEKEGRISASLSLSRPRLKPQENGSLCFMTRIKYLETLQFAVLGGAQREIIGLLRSYSTLLWRENMMDILLRFLCASDVPIINQLAESIWRMAGLVVEKEAFSACRRMRRYILYYTPTAKEWRKNHHHYGLTLLHNFLFSFFFLFLGWGMRGRGESTHTLIFPSGSSNLGEDSIEKLWGFFLTWERRA